MSERVFEKHNQKHSFIINSKSNDKEFIILLQKIGNITKELIKETKNNEINDQEAYVKSIPQLSNLKILVDLEQKPSVTKLYPYDITSNYNNEENNFITTKKDACLENKYKNYFTFNESNLPTKVFLNHFNLFTKIENLFNKMYHVHLKSYGCLLLIIRSYITDFFKIHGFTDDIYIIAVAVI